MNVPAITFVIPSYNEERNIHGICEAIKDEMRVYPELDYEMLFIDDGSSDKTLVTIERLSFQCPRVKFVSFTRNFGKEAAIFAGLQNARGDAVIMMDADLQHPPTLIHDLLAGYREGYHQVVAKRDRKGDSKARSLLSSLYYKMVNKTIDVKLSDGEGDFRLLSRKAVDALLALTEGHRFSKGLYAWIGLDRKTICYENVPRQEGETKWSIGKLLNYGIDGIVGFNSKPLRLCFYLGALILLMSLGYIIWAFIEILKYGVQVPGYFTLISAVLFLGGIQLVSLGIIGEYIGRIYNETKKRPHYLVKVSNVDKEGESPAMYAPSSEAFRGRARGSSNV